MKVITVNDRETTFTYDIPLDCSENAPPLFFNPHNRDTLTPIRVLVFCHQKFVADFSRQLTLFKPSFSTNWKSAGPNNKMLCNMNGGVPELGLKPIEILCEEQGHSCVMPIESADEIKPFFSDENVSYFWNGFEQFEPLWLCSVQFPMLSGRNHCVLVASAGSDDRMYALFQVPLPPAIIITHDPAMITVQGANLHDP
jgi:hypothetical protein